MSVTIVERQLTPQEAAILSVETKKSPHIGYIAPYIWSEFTHVFVASDRGELLGVCAVVPLRHYLKLGPIVVLEQHQGKHIGSQLLQKISSIYSKRSLYIGSSNPRVHSIIAKLGFTRVNYWNLPLEIKLYLLSYLWQRGNVEYILDSLTKISRHHRGPYHFYLRK